LNFNDVRGSDRNRGSIKRGCCRVGQIEIVKYTEDAGDDGFVELSLN
jgi:hypothetical protein